MSVRTLAPAGVVREGVLDALRVTVTPSGVALGCDGYSAPVLLPLFGPAPVSVTFVGGWWAAQLLVHRCLGYGATVVVDAPDTATPARHGTLAGLDQWLTLDRLAGGAGRVRPAGGDAGWPSRTHPHLSVHDVGPGGPAGVGTPRPWQARLTVLARITPASQPALAQSDVVLAQRLDPREAAMVGGALLLPAEFTSQIGAMPNETLAACRSGQVRYLWLQPTAMERQAFG